MHCNVTFVAARWNELAGRKHRVNGSVAERKWDRSLLKGETANGEDSLYNPYLNQGDIELWEMECATDDTKRGGELDTGKCHFRRFYRRLPNEIGASQGEKTSYILVQYNSDGAVHGYPVTEGYLRSKGATL